MSDSKRYAESIYESINNNFKLLDTLVQECSELSTTIEAYYQAKNELNLDIDKVVKDKAEFEQKYRDSLKNLYVKEQTLKPYVCDGYNTLEPLTVGLFGEWGSGKTRILREIKNHTIKRQDLAKRDWELRAKIEGEGVPMPLQIPIFFNAWRFEKDEHIIIPLFQTMLSELEKYDYIDSIKVIKQKLQILLISLIKNLQIPKDFDISKLLSGDFKLSVLGSFFNFAGVFDSFSKAEQESNYNYLLEQILQSGRLESVYVQIPQWLEKITILDNVRFIFLIDDLDRCLPENALKMLESIKLFLDVPGCAFVLAVDDDVVERGVEHHYRDYLKNSNHLIIEQDKNTQIIQKSLAINNRADIPITGAEYLEKMVQLPFRIPQQDIRDVKNIITSRYPRFKEVDKKETAELGKNSKTDSKNRELLEFFARYIPRKPRKIIRTIELYLSKESLLQSVGIKIEPILLAKLTLLELFAPKLYRFMQNKGFVKMFERLVEWKEEVAYLSNTKKIEEKLIKDKDNFEQKDYEDLLALVDILHSIFAHRVEFNLDIVFESSYEKEQILDHIKYKQHKKPLNIKEGNLKPVAPIDAEKFFARLLSQDRLSWSSAFSDDAFSEAGSVMDGDTFNELLEKLKEHKTLVQEPEWLELVSKYLRANDFIKLLEVYNPFKGE